MVAFNFLFRPPPPLVERECLVHPVLSKLYDGRHGQSTNSYLFSTPMGSNSMSEISNIHWPSSGCRRRHVTPIIVRLDAAISPPFSSFWTFIPCPSTTMTTTQTHLKREKREHSQRSKSFIKVVMSPESGTSLSKESKPCLAVRFAPSSFLVD